MKKQTKNIRKAFTLDTVDVFTEFTHKKTQKPLYDFEGWNIGVITHRPKSYYQAVLVPLDRLYVEETGYHRSRYQAIKEAKRIIRRYYLETGRDYLKGLEVNPINIEA